VQRPTLTQGYIDPAGNGRPALRWDLKPVLISGSPAEIAEITGVLGPTLRRDGYPALIGVTPAEIAEITGDLGPALLRDGYPALIGVTPAETAETPDNRVMRKSIISLQAVTALQVPCF
jgi:hypothetical protein